MPFSEDVRAKALVASARHCCVCHRYAGVKIEVHHIEQEAHGGPNSLENAIPLCFDCHCDAGHYNDKHPKGTKFSTKELKIARDNWYAKVQTGAIVEASSNENEIHCRYLICKEEEILKEIIREDFKSVPLSSPRYLKTEILENYFATIRSVSGDHGQMSIWAKRYHSSDEYLASFPEAIKIDKSSSNDTFYLYKRTPSRDELLESYPKLNGFIRHCIDSCIAPIDFSTAFLYEDECGYSEGKLYQEVIRFRDSWVAFLSISNYSDQPKVVSEVAGIGNPDFVGYREFGNEHGLKPMVVKLPQVPIFPNETIFFPIGVVLAPIEKIHPEYFSVVEEPMGEKATSDEIEHLSFKEYAQSFRFFGKLFLPTFLELSHTQASVPIHRLDLSNLYTLNRFWHMGSCPHLFWVDSSDNLIYVKELFSKGPKIVQIEQLQIPVGVRKVAIAELEFETTFLSKILIDGKKVAEDVSLGRNEFIEFSAEETFFVEIEGYYALKSIEFRKADSQFHNEVVCRFMHMNSLLRTNQ